MANRRWERMIHPPSREADLFLLLLLLLPLFSLLFLSNALERWRATRSMEGTGFGTFYFNTKLFDETCDTL